MSRIESVAQHIHKIAKKYGEMFSEGQAVLSVKDFLAEAALTEMMRPCETARDFTGMAKCAEATKRRFSANPDQYIESYLGNNENKTYNEMTDLKLRDKSRQFTTDRRQIRLNRATAKFNLALEHVNSQELHTGESKFEQEMDAIDRHFDRCFEVIQNGYYNDSPQFLNGFLLAVYGCME